MDNFVTLSKHIEGLTEKRITLQSSHDIRYEMLLMVAHCNQPATEYSCAVCIVTFHAQCSSI